MIKIFDETNVKTILRKRPLICFRNQASDDLPSFCNGLLFVMFEDNSVYSYSTYGSYSGDDLPSVKRKRRKIIKSICKHVPEMASLFPPRHRPRPKRETFVHSMHFVNLGMKTSCYINNGIHRENVMLDVVSFTKALLDVYRVDLRALYKTTMEEMGADMRKVSVPSEEVLKQIIEQEFGFGREKH